MPNDRQLTNAANNIAVGDIVSGLTPEELVAIRSIQPFGSKTLIEAVGADTARMIKREVKTVTLDDASEDFSKHLNLLWRELVENHEWILKRVGGVTLRESGLIPEGDGAISVKDAIESFLRYIDKHMIANAGAVTDGLQQACSDGIIGIGRGASSSNLKAKFCRQSVSLVPDDDGVWIIPPFEPEKEQPEDTGAGQQTETQGAGEGAGRTNEQYTGV